VGAAYRHHQDHWNSAVRRMISGCFLTTTILTLTKSGH
jgi:hypothetical protein